MKEKIFYSEKFVFPGQIVIDQSYSDFAGHLFVSKLFLAKFRTEKEI